MLHPVALLVAVLPAQVQVEIVRQPHPGGVGVCSSNGAWATGAGLVGARSEPIALRWSDATGFERLHGTGWAGLAIADDGGTVLTLAPNADGVLAAALWTPAGMQVLPDLGGASGWAASAATGLTRDGAFAAGFAYPWHPLGYAFQRAVRWSAAGALLELATPVGTTSTASDLSDDGRVVVGSVTPLGGPYYGPGAIQNTSSAVWTDGVLELIDDGGQAFGVSSDGGWVVGLRLDVPYRWDSEHGTQLLDVLRPRNAGSFLISQGLQVSDDGRTVLCEEVMILQASYVPLRRYLWIEGRGAVPIGELLAGVGAHELLAFDQLRLVSMSSDARTLTGTAFERGPREGSVFWRVTLPANAAPLR